jgi:hypothetical protein
MITAILSWLLHHANRETKMEEFYRIKDRILTRYGKVIGYDVQFIEGKICHSCNGTGVYKKYSWYTGKVYEIESCNRCWRGWYKPNTWILLQRIRLGRYIFHKPLQRETKFKKNPFKEVDGWQVSNEVISGYIDHNRTKHGKDALVILYLLYDWKRYWKRWYQTIGRGWYCHWSWIYKPQKWPNNIAHLIRYRSKAIPIRDIKEKLFPPPSVQHSIDDLPF